jgi:hypothetical protein
MQHLVGSRIEVEGPAKLDTLLPVPPPHEPNRFAGMSDAHRAMRDEWFKDVAVLAFPTPDGEMAGFDSFEIKTLKDVQPYSLVKSAPTFIWPEADYREPDQTGIIDADRIINLTSRMKEDGSLSWEVPRESGRSCGFVARSTGQTTRPAPRTGHGFECDKFSAEAYRHHWNNYQAKLLEQLPPLTPGKGLTTITSTAGK